MKQRLAEDGTLLLDCPLAKHAAEIRAKSPKLGSIGSVLDSVTDPKTGRLLIVTDFVPSAWRCFDVRLSGSYFSSVLSCSGQSVSTADSFLDPVRSFHITTAVVTREPPPIEAVGITISFEFEAQDPRGYGRGDPANEEARRGGWQESCPSRVGQESVDRHCQDDGTSVDTRGGRQGQHPGAKSYAYGRKPRRDVRHLYRAVEGSVREPNDVP